MNLILIIKHLSKVDKSTNLLQMLLTLLVLPILYRLAHRPDEQEEDVTAEPAHEGVAA